MILGFVPGLVNERRTCPSSRIRSARVRDDVKLALMKAGVAAFILTSGDLQGQEMARIFVRALAAIKRFLKKHKKPFIAKIGRDGSISLLFKDA